MTTLTHTGIDLSPLGLIIAEHDPQAQKMLVSIIGESDNPKISDAPVSIGVPGKDVIIKPLRMKLVEGVDIIPRLKFELASSMLEPENGFLFDIIPTIKDEHFLGLVFRRDRLNAFRNQVIPPDDSRPIQFSTRSLALAKGYVNFCDPLRDGLVAVVHVSKIEISFCILFDKKPVSLGHLAVDNYHFDDDRSLKRLTYDLKTVINFKLDTLAREGLSVPLSALILSGEQTGSDMVEPVSSCFGIDVSIAKIKSSLGLNTEDQQSQAALIALGLMVN